MERTSQGNDFELILMVNIGTRHSVVEGLSRSEFLAISNHCGVLTALSRKTLTIILKFYVFWKTTLYGEIFSNLFCKFSLQH